MRNLIYIKSFRGEDGSWFFGPGWYYIDEAYGLQYGGKTKKQALERYATHIQRLEADTVPGVYTAEQ